MLEIRTICFGSEVEFDKEVNLAIQLGWKPDFSTFRVTSFGFGALSSSHSMQAKGTFNTIVLTRGA